MNFSSILDISSFFIGMIINLLLVALVSYYFKRKYEHLEKSIDEHSEHIYMLLKKERDSLRNNSCVMGNNLNEKILYPSLASSTSNSSKNSTDSDCNDESYSSDSDSEDDETSNSDIDEIDEIYENDKLNNVVELLEAKPLMNEANVMVEEVTNSQDVKQLTIQEITTDDNNTTFNIHKIESLPQDYNKLTMKQLKDLLSNKGISVKPNMKKNDLIDLASKNSIEFDNDLTSSSKNPSHISLTDCELNLTNLNDVTSLE